MAGVKPMERNRAAYDLGMTLTQHCTIKPQPRRHRTSQGRERAKLGLVERRSPVITVKNSCLDTFGVGIEVAETVNTCSVSSMS